MPVATQPATLAAIDADLATARRNLALARTQRRTEPDVIAGIEASLDSLLDRRLDAQ